MTHMILMSLQKACMTISICEVGCTTKIRPVKMECMWSRGGQPKSSEKTLDVNLKDLTGTNMCGFAWFSEMTEVKTNVCAIPEKTKQLSRPSHTCRSKPLAATTMREIGWVVPKWTRNLTMALSRRSRDQSSTSQSPNPDVARIAAYSQPMCCSGTLLCQECPNGMPAHGLGSFI
jgi:hypothetical protein